MNCGGILQFSIKQQIERIVRLQIDRVASRLAGRKMGLKLTDGAVAHLADVGYDPVYGARPVKRSSSTARRRSASIGRRSASSIRT